MLLTNREQEKLMIYTASKLALERKERFITSDSFFQRQIIVISGKMPLFYFQVTNAAILIKVIVEIST